MKTQNDVILIGGGIMSATMGVIMNKLMPEAKIILYEKLEKVASESTDGWNNAGTGHSAFCELNYTPQQADGSVNIEKALTIASSFEVSRQFWAYLKDQGVLTGSIIKTVPHMSFVWGENNISFLKKRHEAMTAYALFENMKYSEDFDEVESWVPMMMKNRARDERMGVTKMTAGTDVDFEMIARGMMAHLKETDGFEVKTNHEVKGFKKLSEWLGSQCL